jgi:hypothetical protein
MTLLGAETNPGKDDPQPPLVVIEGFLGLLVLPVLERLMGHCFALKNLLFEEHRVEFLI